jgi:hypothetical protein
MKPKEPTTAIAANNAAEALYAMDDRGDFEDINRGLVVEIDKTLTPDGEVVFDFAECTRLSDGGLRTNYGPCRPNSAHLNGQPWTPAISGSRSTTVEARSGGQGAASSNRQDVCSGSPEVSFPSCAREYLRR